MSQPPYSSDSPLQPVSSVPLSIVVTAEQVDNAVLKRLIQEVQVENHNNINAYNRTHNRHNRGR